MESEIVIRHLEVRYVDLENMGNGKKSVEHFRDFHSGIKVGWLVGCFGFNGPLRQYFSLYRAVSQREGERGEKG